MKDNGEEGSGLARSPKQKIKPLWRENYANSHDGDFTRLKTRLIVHDVHP